MMNMKIEVVDYDPRWPEAFDLEQRALQADITEKVKKQEHIKFMHFSQVI